MTEVWRAVENFTTANRRFRPVGALTDANGVAITGAGAEITVREDIPVKPEDIVGAKSFDNIVLGGEIELNRYTLTATITAGSSLSSAIPLSDRPINYIVVPAGWDDAVLTFRVSLDGTNYYELEAQDGSAISLPVEAGKVLRLDTPAAWAGYPYMKVRSGTSGSPVNQSEDMTITLRVSDA